MSGTPSDEPVADALADLRRRRRAEVASAIAEVRDLQRSHHQMWVKTGDLQAELEALRATKMFRFLEPVRRAYGRARDTLRPAVDAPVAPPPPTPNVDYYRRWIDHYDTVDEHVRARLEARIGELDDPPTISVIMPVYDPEHAHLRTAVDSVLAQTYPHWELCIADDCSSDPTIAPILDSYAAVDDRIRVVHRDRNGHIAAASNSALEMCTGSWIAPLDHDDAIPVHALALVALAAVDNPDAGFIYSDEDKLTTDGRRVHPGFKPDFDPLLVLAQNYVTHFGVLRRDLVEKVGGYREGFEGSQDWDLMLRVTEQLTIDQVVHIPHVLYHWRMHEASTALSTHAKPYVVASSRRAVEEHLERTGTRGTVRSVVDGSMLRVAWTLPEPAPRVSIIIPTRDGPFLERCLHSLFILTTYPDVEILVVDNGSTKHETLSYLRTHEDLVRVIRDDAPFNYSRLNNEAVQRASGDVICLLNDDTEVMTPDWLDELVGQLMQPGVGAVGARLLYDDGRVQHAGVVLGIGGVAGHSHRGYDRLQWGYGARLHTVRTVSAVTGACVVVRRQAWEEVGGLDEEFLPIAFNDVDFCLRLRAAGWRIVWTPYAELIHHESATRGPDTHGAAFERFAVESRIMKMRWGRVLRSDPYYNPNLTLDAEDYALAWPPRVSLA
jgi:O-antigen biosynthesis protein